MVKQSMDVLLPMTGPGSAVGQVSASVRENVCNNSKNEKVTFLD